MKNEALSGSGSGSRSVGPGGMRIRGAESALSEKATPFELLHALRRAVSKHVSKHVSKSVFKAPGRGMGGVDPGVSA